MTDTPETEAQLTTFTSISKYGKHFENKTGTVSAEFARELERERNGWRLCAEALEEYISKGDIMDLDYALINMECLNGNEA